MHAEHERCLAAVRAAEHREPFRVDLGPAAEPLQRSPEVLEWNVVKRVGESRRVKVAHRERRDAVGGQPLAQPGRVTTSFGAADHEHGHAVPCVGRRVQRPGEPVPRHGVRHGRIGPPPPAADKGDRGDRLRRGDRRQHEALWSAPPPVGRERQSVRRRHRGQQAHRPDAGVGAARQRLRVGDVDHALLVRAEGRPRHESDPMSVGRAQLEPDALQAPETVEVNPDRLVFDRGSRCHLEAHRTVRGAATAHRDDGEEQAGEQDRAHRAPLSCVGTVAAPTERSYRARKPLSS